MDIKKFQLQLKKAFGKEIYCEFKGCHKLVTSFYKGRALCDYHLEKTKSLEWEKRWLEGKRKLKQRREMKKRKTKIKVRVRGARF